MLGLCLGYFFIILTKKQLWKHRVYLGNDDKVQSVMTVKTGKSWRQEMETTAHTVSTAGNQRTRNAGAGSLSPFRVVQD